MSQRLTPQAAKFTPGRVEALGLPVIVADYACRHEQPMLEQPAQRLYSGDVEVAVEVDN